MTREAPGRSAEAGQAGRVDAARAALGYRPDLDGLRALSCLLVFCFHIQKSRLWLGEFAWMQRLEGWVGVYVFFALSGFLITTLLLGEEAREGRIRYGRFFLRREFRIVPAYYATVGLYGLLCLSPAGAGNAAEYRAGIWWWLSYCGDVATRIPAVGTLLGHSWSLAVEQRFYLVWPLLLFGVSRRWRWRSAVTVALAAGLALLPLEVGAPYLALVLGGWAAMLRGLGLGTERLRGVRPWLAAAAVLAAFGLTGWNWHFLTLFSASVAVLIWRLGEDRSWVRAALGWRPLAWLGRVSYSFYLLHVVAINVAMRVVRPEGAARAAAATGLALGLAVLLAWAGHAAVEEPFRRLGRRWTG